MKKTRKSKRIQGLILLLSLGITSARAQQAVVTTGSDASGTGGTASYTIGQIAYTSATGAVASVSQGVQQAFEIQTVLGIEDHQIRLDLKAYPNPTTDYLILNVGDYELSTLKFELYDLSGKLIQSKKIVDTTESIQMKDLPSATYFLKVSNDNKGIKTFKILKY